jgi:hypothetical protein
LDSTATSNDTEAGGIFGNRARTSTNRTIRKQKEDLGGFSRRVYSKQEWVRLVGFNSTPVQESPAIAAEGRDIELRESTERSYHWRLLRSDKSTTEDPTTSTGCSVGYYHHINRRILWGKDRW